MRCCGEPNTITRPPKSAHNSTSARKYSAVRRRIVGSVLVRLTPRPAPVDVDRVALFEVIEEGFAERRKTMSNALRRMGLDAAAATEVLRSCGVGPKARAEELDLDAFAALASAVRTARGGNP